MTLQGHPRSIMAPIESAYMTSYSTSIVTLVLSCRVSEILELLYAESHFFQHSTRIRAKIDPRCLGCKERTSQANWRWNYFGRIPIYVITIHKRYRQTDRETTCDDNTALCTKVHRAVKTPKNVGSSYAYNLHLSCRTTRDGIVRCRCVVRVRCVCVLTPLELEHNFSTCILLKSKHHTGSRLRLNSTSTTREYIGGVAAYAAYIFSGTTRSNRRSKIISKLV